LGFVSKKIKLNPVANPAHNATNPNANLVMALIPVKLPNAFALKNLGKLSISIER
jgi:hypothetical protein